MTKIVSRLEMFHSAKKNEDFPVVNIYIVKANGKEVKLSTYFLQPMDKEVLELTGLLDENGQIVVPSEKKA